MVKAMLGLTVVVLVEAALVVYGLVIDNETVVLMGVAGVAFCGACWIITLGNVLTTRQLDRTRDDR